MRQQVTGRQRGRPTEIRGIHIQPIVFNGDRLDELKSAYPKKSTSEIIRDLVEDKLEWLSKKNPDGSDRALPIGNVYKHDDPKQITLDDYFQRPTRFVEECFSKVTNVNDVIELSRQFNTKVLACSRARQYQIKCRLN